MGERTRRIVLVGVMAGLALLVGVGAGMAERAPTSTPGNPIPTSTAQPAVIDVHVAGWVVFPGVVSVPEGSIVADAIDAVGGFRPGADPSGVNLAARIGAGTQIVIPGPEGPRESGSESGDGILSLNGASAIELQELPGVGPVLAERIIAHRETHGRFETVEDLLGVSGIGESKLAGLRDLVRP